MSNESLLQIEVKLKGRSLKSKLFSKDAMIIGRDPGADICLDNPGVSREHARITRRDDGSFTVEDLGSTNGTFVSGKAVQNTVLKDGDVVVCGKFSLHVSLEPVDRESTLASLGRDSIAADGTTVLTTDQLARVIEAQEGHPEPELHVISGSAESESPSRMKVLLIGGLVVIAAVALTFSLLK